MKTLFWILKESFNAARLQMVVSTLLGLIAALVPAAQVLVFSVVAKHLGETPSIDAVVLPLILLALCVAVGPNLVSAVEVLRTRGSQHLQARLNVRLTQKISTFSPSDLVDPDLPATAERHSRAITEQLSFVPLRLTRAIETAGGSVAVILALMSISNRAALFALLAIVPPLFLSQILAKVWDRQWRDVAVPHDRERYLRELLLRPRTAFELSAYGGSARIGREIAARWREILLIMGRALRPQIVGLILVAACCSILLFLALWMVVEDAGSAGEVMSGLYGVIAATAGTAGAGVYFGLVMESAPSAKSFHGFLDRSYHGQRFQSGLEVHGLRASELSFTYPGSSTPDLRGASLEVELGEMVAIVGANGAGKSTLVNCILGVRDVDSGQIVIDDSPLRSADSGSWFSHFAYLPQDFGRFELSVRESLLLGIGMLECSDGELWDALKAAQLQHVVESFPDGLDQMIGEQWGGVGLSGGEWQRMALARVYLRGAPVWILDEPTSSVDAETEMELFKELWRTKGGRLTIVVSHRAWTLRYTDRIYVMQDGAVAEVGTYDDLLARQGLFYRIFSEQAGA